MNLDRAKNKQVYVILSVDTEHDIISKYKTKSAGWSNGLPLLFRAFDKSGVKGKVCWLIEYNVKEGLISSNPDSVYFVKEFPEFIEEIKDRGDELGLHPTLAEWLGTKNSEPTSIYTDHSLWDVNKRYDPEFIMGMITSGIKEMEKATGVHPVGCRTGRMNYGTHLATALEKNGVYIDSSVSKRLVPWIVAPNAYYANGIDIRKKSPDKTGVLEIPTTGYIYFDGLQKLLLHKTRIWYWYNHRKPIFLSFFIHNWQAVTSDGGEDKEYLSMLFSFLEQLRGNGACFLSWAEAHEKYKELCRKK